MLEGNKEPTKQSFIDELDKTISFYLQLQSEQLKKIDGLRNLYGFDHPRALATKYPGQSKIAVLCESLHQFDLHLRGPLTIICHSLKSLAQQFKKMDPVLLVKLLNNPINVALTAEERLMLEYIETSKKAAEINHTIMNYASELIELAQLLLSTVPVVIEASQASSPTVNKEEEDPDFVEDATAMVAKLTLSKPLPAPKTTGLLAKVQQYRTKNKSNKESNELGLSGSWDSGAWDSSKWESLKKEAEDVTPHVTTTSQTDESLRKLKDKSKSFAPLYDLSNSEEITQPETSRSVPKKRLGKSRSFS
jgi:hypothetical protein